MEWKHCSNELPKETRSYLGFCVNEDDDIEWVGFVQVYFNPFTGWHRCELYDKKPVRVIQWTELPEHPQPIR